MVKRSAVLKKIKDEAKRQGLPFETRELSRHTGVIVGSTRSTLGRHREVDDHTARKFFEQFAAEFGKGWWR